MQKADLHLHSNKSDGLLSPFQIVEQAAKCKLDAIALTDHDTVEGIDEAIAAGQEYGIDVVPGIEVNTSADNGELHILGYYIDHKDGCFIEALKKLKQSRLHRIQSIIEKLQNQGFDITLEQVRSKAGKADSLGRPHIARVLQEQGYVSNIKEAFERYIGYGCPAYVERYKLLPRQAIELIKSCGGVPVLAHPGVLSNGSYIDMCIKQGIQGIEVYHSRHNNCQAEHFERIARRHNLISTGGSDCHGDGKYDGKMLIGQFTVSYEVVEILKSAAYNNGKNAENQTKGR